MGANITNTIAKFFDNSLDNIGRGNSVCTERSLKLSPIDHSVDVPRPNVGASRYCSFKNVQRLDKPRFKSSRTDRSAWSTEGGIRCPSIIAYPGSRNNSITHEFTTVMDILPTVVSPYHPLGSLALM
jgi:hypothetical protein